MPARRGRLSRRFVGAKPSRLFYPGIIDKTIYPGVNTLPAGQRTGSMKPADDAQFTAFEGPRQLVSGSLAKVALTVKKWSDAGSSSAVLIFDDRTGRAIDLDLRGTDREALLRLAAAGQFPAMRRCRIRCQAEARGRGRPKLGVVARRNHLAAASLGMARRAAGWRLGGVAKTGRAGAPRQWRQGPQPRRARRRLSFHVGNGRQPARLRGGRARALFADDRRRFVGLIAAWPADIRDHAVKLAFSHQAEPPAA